MRYRLFDWHEHIKDVEGEYKTARFALDHLKARLISAPDLFAKNHEARSNLSNTDQNLEGTYLVRIFAAFEAALRSFDQAKNNDPTRREDASVLIDSIGGRRGQGISNSVRLGAHQVRRARNACAHESDVTSEFISIRDARARLQTYLSWLPEEWG